MSNLNLNDFIDEDKEFDGRSSVIAAVLCLFLGMFGIHSFYVGRSKSGTIRFLLGIICVVCALLHVKVGFLIFLIAFFLFFVDFARILKGNYRDSDGNKLIKSTPVYFHILKVISLPYICLMLVLSSLFLQDSEPHISNNSISTPRNISNNDIPINKMSFEALYKCKYEKEDDEAEKCAAEYNKRLEIAVRTIDSIYAEGNVREAIKLSRIFYDILQSDGSTINFEEYVPTKDGVIKRIEKLLPPKGCIQDSVQYANYLSTIYEIEKVLDSDDETMSKINKKYFSYLNRNCKLLHYDANVIITEERFVKAALNRKDITSTKANALFNDIFKKIDEADFTAMKSMNEGKSFKGYGIVEKKKNRTISYIEAPSKEFNDATALAVAAFKVFSFEAYFPFTLHPSVENVEIGFNISELEYNWYAGYYHGIYAVTIKTNKKTLDRYYEKNNIKPPKSIKSDNAMSDDDKNFFAQPLTYSSIKRWCNKNGFVCSKYLVERTK